MVMKEGNFQDGLQLHCQRKVYCSEGSCCQHSLPVAVLAMKVVLVL